MRQAAVLPAAALLVVAIVVAANVLLVVAPIAAEGSFVPTLRVRATETIQAACDCASILEPFCRGCTMLYLARTNVITK
jgi:hypothetical protein